MEAFIALGEKEIPAEFTETSREEQLLMSLVENLARRPSSNRDLLREIKNLRQRNYSDEEIAAKIGHSASYVAAITHLMEHHAADLIQAVESGRLPISVALRIANGNDREVQLAMSEAYESGDLRGHRFRDAKRLVAQRIASQKKTGKLNKAKRKLTAEGLVREYKQRMREQRNLVKKAIYTKDRLLLLTTAVRRLFEDEHFVTLLRAEKLSDLPEPLASRLRLGSI
jgi:ParB family chromosome partitioning protein